MCEGEQLTWGLKQTSGFTPGVFVLDRIWVSRLRQPHRQRRTAGEGSQPPSMAGASEEIVPHIELAKDTGRTTATHSPPVPVSRNKRTALREWTRCG